jgi:hypothetical protein
LVDIRFLLGLDTTLVAVMVSNFMRVRDWVLNQVGSHHCRPTLGMKNYGPNLFVKEENSLPIQNSNRDQVKGWHPSVDVRGKSMKMFFLFLGLIHY